MGYRDAQHRRTHALSLTPIMPHVNTLHCPPRRFLHKPSSPRMHVVAPDGNLSGRRMYVQYRADESLCNRRILVLVWDLVVEMYQLSYAAFPIDHTAKRKDGHCGQSSLSYPPAVLKRGKRGPLVLSRRPTMPAPEESKTESITVACLLLSFPLISFRLADAPDAVLLRRTFFDMVHMVEPRVRFDLGSAY